MASAWLNAEGQIVVEDGVVKICDECPCEGACQCDICTGTIPSAFQITLAGFVDGLCLTCDTDFNGTFTVVTDGSVLFTCLGTGLSPCGFLLCVDTSCGGHLLFCDTARASLVLCMGIDQGTFDWVIRVRLTYNSSDLAIWELTYPAECPLVCDEIIDLELPLVFSSVNIQCTAAAATCFITSII